VRTRLELVFAFGVEELVGAFVVGFGDEDFGHAIEVEFVAFGIDEFLRGDDAVLFEHGDEEFGVYERACVEEFQK
jgi:hypothetical protein